VLCRVVKRAFDPALVAEVERVARPLAAVAGATVEEDEPDTRQCELRWITRGSEEFRAIEEPLLAVLAREGAVDPGLCLLEDLQYTAYRPGGFHDWHIDAYRRPYNRYDLPLGERFVGRKRKVSVSVLLNGTDEFTGGAFEVSMFPNGRKTVGSKVKDLAEAGDLVFFDSKLCHRVAPVDSGLRKSLVAWICA
jgi:PKHD-type hydroxylase